MARVFGIYMLSESFLNPQHEQNKIWFLVNQIFELSCRPRITKRLINQLKQTITTFMTLIKEHAPECIQTLCMHMVVHIPEQLELWGPSRTIWMFAFERFNAFLADLTRGTKHATESLTRATHIATALVSLDWDDYITVIEPAYYDFIIPSEKKGKMYSLEKESSCNDVFGHFPYYATLKNQYHNRKEFLSMNFAAFIKEKLNTFSAAQQECIRLFTHELSNFIAHQYHHSFSLNGMKVTTHKNRDVTGTTAACHFRTLGAHFGLTHARWIYGTIKSYLVLIDGKKELPYEKKVYALEVIL